MKRENARGTGIDTPHLYHVFVIKNSKVWVEREMKFSNPFDIFIFFKKENKLYNTRCLSLSQYSVTTHKTTFHLLLWTECERERERVWVLSQFLLTPKITITWRGLNTLLIKIQIEKNYLVLSLSLSLSAIYVSVYQFLLRVLIFFVSDRTAGGGGASTSSPRTVTLFSLTSHFPFLLKR